MAALPSRNEILGFTGRTLCNLISIEKAYENDPNSDIHVVTQLILSLLGILVFPYAKLDKLEKPIFSKTLKEAKDEGWLGWRITMDNAMGRGGSPDPTKTVADLVRHLRNAIAHARITFRTDSRNLSEEILTFEDAPSSGRLKDKVNWRAEVSGDKLRNFCVEFLQLVESAMN